MRNISGDAIAHVLPLSLYSNEFSPVGCSVAHHKEHETSTAFGQLIRRCNWSSTKMQRSIKAPFVSLVHTTLLLPDSHRDKDITVIRGEYWAPSIVQSIDYTQSLYKGNPLVILVGCAFSKIRADHITEKFRSRTFSSLGMKQRWQLWWVFRICSNLILTTIINRMS